MINTKNLLVFLISSLLVISSCTKKTEESLLLDAKNKMEEAKKLEADNKVDEARKDYEQVIDIYNDFLSGYPSSTKAPDVYSTIAKIYSDNLKDYTSAIKYYKELTDKFPDTKESKYGLFMIAFIYDEMLKDKELAKQSYQKFLDKYPKDEDPNEKMSESARMMLQMLQENKSIEDVIKNVQQDEKKDTAAAKNKDTKENQDNKDKKDAKVVPPTNDNANPDGSVKNGTVPPPPKDKK